jgi:predicted lipoprotein with Yx(FWY)xxD motif
MTLHRSLAALPALAVVLAASACGQAIPDSNGGSATVTVASSDAGRVLADERGRSVYIFRKDEEGESYCDGACAAVWPPVETDGTLHGAAGVDQSMLATVKRGDGHLQVLYAGHPLYYYAGDGSTPGRTNGQGVVQFGDEWHLVRPSGAPALEAKQQSDSGGGSNGGGGGGYYGGGGGY